MVPEVWSLPGTVRPDQKAACQLAYPDSTRDQPLRPQAHPQGHPQGHPEGLPGVASVTHLPTSRVPEEHITLLLESVTAAPGLGADTLRIRARLDRPDFEAALAACRAQVLLRSSSREDGNHRRTRFFPTRQAIEALEAAPRPGRKEDAS